MLKNKKDLNKHDPEKMKEMIKDVEGNFALEGIEPHKPGSFGYKLNQQLISGEISIDEAIEIARKKTFER